MDALSGLRSLFNFIGSVIVYGYFFICYFAAKGLHKLTPISTNPEDSVLLYTVFLIIAVPLFVLIWVSYCDTAGPKYDLDAYATRQAEEYKKLVAEIEATEAREKEAELWVTNAEAGKTAEVNEYSI